MDDDQRFRLMTSTRAVALDGMADTFIELQQQDMTVFSV
jgi:hypothetical protein